MEWMMSVGEANRLRVMRQVDKKVLNMKRASEELGISLRQAWRQLSTWRRSRKRSRPMVGQRFSTPTKESSSPLRSLWELYSTRASDSVWTAEGGHSTIFLSSVCGDR